MNNNMQFDQLSKSDLQYIHGGGIILTGLAVVGAVGGIGYIYDNREQIADGLEDGWNTVKGWFFE